jgi:thiol-disulfide isomerase/thioredoxin
MTFVRSALTACAATLLLGCSPRNPIPEYVPPRPAFAENGWPSILQQHDEYEGTGIEVGDSMLPFQVYDQDGEVVTGGLGDQNNNLVDFRQLLGHTVLLDLSTVWCGPCNKAAAGSAELLDEMQAIAPSLIVTILVQNIGGAPATVVDAEDWAEDYNAEYPVLIDTPEEATRTAWGGPGFPTFWLVGPTGEIFDRFTAVPSETDVLDGVRFSLEEWGSEFRQIDDPTDNSE